jgi:hypothetical protein
MATRMWKRSFMFYVLLLALPNIVLGLWLAIYPQGLLPAFLPAGYAVDSAILPVPAPATDETDEPAQDATTDPQLNPEMKYLARLAGLGLFMVSMLLFTARNEPGRNREFMFWMSLYYAGLAALNIGAVFFREINLWTLPAGVFWLVAAAFLMAFASRNLLVRE